jgi:hypothetical protein
VKRTCKQRKYDRQRRQHEALATVTEVVELYGAGSPAHQAIRRLLRNVLPPVGASWDRAVRQLKPHKRKDKRHPAPEGCKRKKNFRPIVKWWHNPRPPIKQTVLPAEQYSSVPDARDDDDNSGKDRT